VRIREPCPAKCHIHLAWQYYFVEISLSRSKTADQQSRRHTGIAIEMTHDIGLTWRHCRMLCVERPSPKTPSPTSCRFDFEDWRQSRNSTIGHKPVFWSCFSTPLNVSSHFVESPFAIEGPSRRCGSRYRTPSQLQHPARNSIRQFIRMSNSLVVVAGFALQGDQQLPPPWIWNLIVAATSSFRRCLLSFVYCDSGHHSNWPRIFQCRPIARCVLHNVFQIADHFRQFHSKRIVN
jgi:hypothetical protein